MGFGDSLFWGEVISHRWILSPLGCTISLFYVGGTSAVHSRSRSGVDASLGALRASAPTTGKQQPKHTPAALRDCPCPTQPHVRAADWATGLQAGWLAVVLITYSSKFSPLRGTPPHSLPACRAHGQQPPGRVRYAGGAGAGHVDRLPQQHGPVCSGLPHHRRHL